MDNPLARLRSERIDLDGKVVFITGASRGIGAEVARRCAAKGARVFLAGLEPELMQALCAELGDANAASLETDVVDLDAVRAAVAAAVERFGRIDVVLANAGIAPYGTVATIGKPTFDLSMAINVGGVWNTLNATLPHVTETRGHVLTVCSVASFAPLGGLHAYTASKAAAESLTSAFAMEVAHLGVTVGSVHPSWIDTDMVRDAEADLPTFRKIRAMLPWPLHSTTTVEKCAAAIVSGMEKRSSRVFSPASVGTVYWSRAMIQAPLAVKFARGMSRRLIPDLEKEVRSLGRSLSARQAAQLEDGDSTGA
ncbi:SDR family oxidoreductase [Hoyosella sp. G463]|uniref:SDR family oxidoreductase n=1 Tax=Lolliginicoccus lacisalsi TaxID=2742202 RepID=A0A927JCB5_9ACTN|nr:SDR family oxidoreductase [Lolliginicoccus lacisalsi]MBD8506693.1 SDR family oxidoreductase [Lolliginicoccus lacisalsi]